MWRRWKVEKKVQKRIRNVLNVNFWIKFCFNDTFFSLNFLKTQTINTNLNDFEKGKRLLYNQLTPLFYFRHQLTFFFLNLFFSPFFHSLLVSLHFYVPYTLISLKTHYSKRAIPWKKIIWIFYCHYTQKHTHFPTYI